MTDIEQAFAKWMPWSEDCPECGNDVEVFTSLSDNQAYEDDPARCVECGAKGLICIDDNGDEYGLTAWVSWEDA